MNDRGKIFLGLGAFLVMALLPFWQSALGARGPKPQPKIITQEKSCVRDTAYMRASHMDLLNQWRDTVVRQGVRTTTTTQGKTIEMSLSRTCMSCHSNKAEFCDSCHNYLAVAPYCWDCHVEPKERT